MAAVLAFGVGFGSGVATIRSTLAPQPDEHLARAAADAGVRASGGGTDAPSQGATAGADRRVQASARGAAGLTALVEPPALDAGRIAVAETGGREALEAHAVAAAARQAMAPPAAFVTDARAAREARPGKAVVRPTPRATEAIVVRRGDTLMDILIRAGIERAEAHAAITALRSIYDPRRLRAGQELVLTAAERARADDASRQLLGLSLDLDFDHKIELTRDDAGAFASAKRAREQTRQLVLRSGRIDNSLYLTAERVAVPPDVLQGLIRLFSWDVDFQRDVQRGDGFEALYEEVSLAGEDRVVRGGDLLFARLDLHGREIAAYRFVRPDGTVEYFDRSGRSLRKFLLRTPIDGARLSSGYGMRHHPILGYSRMHKGVDFAAPTGTPIYAAGGGRIEVAGRKGGYGKYVRIRHNGEYDTAYAHLSRIARGIAPGTRVEQGEVIGYVGTTGRSTGPHLHYEVLKHGSQMNPLNLEHPPTAQLEGEELEQFRAEMARIDRMRQGLVTGTRVAGKMERSGAGGG